MSTTSESGAAAPTAMREQMRHFKKERILEVAQRLFYERGFRGTSLEAIADAMSMTKPFVYGVYDKKTDILFDISIRNIKLSLQALDDSATVTASVAARLADFARRLTQVCIEHREGVTVFFREEGSLEPEHLAIMNEHKGLFDDRLAQLLQAGVATGEFRLRDVRTAALAIGGMLSWTYSWYRANGRLGVEALKDHMAQYALRIAGATEPES